MDINFLKNRTSQILKEKVSISNQFPNIENMCRNQYAKCWLATIFIDICGYTKFCEDNKGDYKIIGKVLRAFHEGIIHILSAKGIKNIEIQGDGIFGVIRCDQKNCNQARLIFEAAMEINGFLEFCWEALNFKISLTLDEELIFVVGNKKNRKLVYGGGSVNLAKKIIEKSKRENTILIDGTFYSNNKDVLYKKEKGCSYCVWDEKEQIYYSDYYIGTWEK